MNWLRTFSIIGLIAVIVGGTAAFVQRTGQEAQEIETAAVELRDIDVSINAMGNVEPAQESYLAFGSSYVVSEIYVEEGDTVRAGDVLARLDLEDYELVVASAETDLARQQNTFDSIVNPPREVDVMAAQAAVDAAEAAYWAAGQTAPTEEEIEVSRIEVELAKNRLWQSQLERDMLEQIPIEFRGSDTLNPRAQEIQVNDGLNQQEIGIEIARQQYQEVQGQGPAGDQFGSSVEAIAAAEISLDNLLNPDTYDVELAALAVHQAALNLESAQAQIVNLEIIAPFDGIVTQNNLNVGEIPPAGPAMVIADTSVLVIQLEVDETDVVNLSLGMPVDVTIEALPESELRGTITHIDLLPMPGKAVPTYQVEVTLNPTAERVQSGMSATGTIAVEQIADAVVVPTRYLEATDEGTFATIIEEGETRRVAVVTGRTSGGYTQIVNGLTPGQRVVLPE